MQDHTETDEIVAGCHGCCQAADEYFANRPEEYFGSQDGHSSCSVTALALAAYRAGYGPEYEDDRWVIILPRNWRSDFEYRNQAGRWHHSPMTSVDNIASE